MDGACQLLLPLPNPSKFYQGDKERRVRGGLIWQSFGGGNNRQESSTNNVLPIASNIYVQHITCWTGYTKIPSVPVFPFQFRLLRCSLLQPCDFTLATTHMCECGMECSDTKSAHEKVWPVELDSLPIQSCAPFTAVG